MVLCQKASSIVCIAPARDVHTCVSLLVVEAIDRRGGEMMVPRGRVELPLSCENRILSPARLPVPPSGHVCHDNGNSLDLPSVLKGRIFNMNPSMRQSARQTLFSVARGC